ncbi:acyl-CoA/acyl-ACP dehydrogenase [Streptomyces sp. NBC_01571]|uniref:acyl-CoA dehydrogenase family protein n=1 Tax=Streptomyces sp. NBC_01571 TaxID=2975883 RepID=UPI00225986DB|nr:acyl-CoA dehydrogenase family protein [Streptomyces sp. NBC_01571]MCX4578879.1 acyl-CoA/acyl-ACP dehydrogenase [Streptomyces sp. NBC_01571]
MFGCVTTERHDELRAQVRAFAGAEVLPRIPLWEQTRSVDDELIREAARRGWIGVTVDPSFGGMGAGHLAKTIIIEELARACGAMGAAVQASLIPVAMIINYGSTEQKARWLPPICRGECLPTIAVTERVSGSHIAGTQGQARRGRGGWLLNVEKAHVGNSHVADLHCVVVRTGPGRGDLSAFLVENERDGVSVRPQVSAMGLNGFSFGTVVMEDVWVPEENLLGMVGEGEDAADSSSVLYGRANLAAVSLGVHRATLDETLRFADETERYGRPLSRLSTVEQRLGQMVANLETAGTLAYAAASMQDRGLACDGALMTAKLMNYELGVKSARLAMEVHAACGVFTDRPLERFFRDAQPIFAPAGTSDVQRLRLARLARGATAGAQWSQRFAAPAPSMVSA